MDSAPLGAGSSFISEGFGTFGSDLGLSSLPTLLDSSAGGFGFCHGSSTSPTISFVLEFLTDYAGYDFLTSFSAADIACYEGT